MRLRNIWVSALGVTLAVSLVACGGKKEETAPADSAAGGQKVDAATAGEVNVLVSFDGVAPANEPIRMTADPVCVMENTTPQTQETYQVAGGKLGNVFVYVKDGLGAYTFDAPTGKMSIDQKNCRYHPHVFGIRVGQTLQIVNSDPTLHNIHALPKGNAEFNTGQPLKDMKTDHVFTAKEVMVPFKCDVHGWMNAYVGVVDNPYFGVTDKDGKLSLKGLPPGTYTIEAWHEKLGTQQVTVTLGAKETKDAAFTFKPAAAGD